MSEQAVNLGGEWNDFQEEDSWLDETQAYLTEQRAVLAAQATLVDAIVEALTKEDLMRAFGTAVPPRLIKVVIVE